MNVIEDERKSKAAEYLFDILSRGLDELSNNVLQLLERNVAHLEVCVVRVSGHVNEMSEKTIRQAQTHRMYPRSAIIRQRTLNQKHISRLEKIRAKVIDKPYAAGLVEIIDINLPFAQQVDLRLKELSNV